jgi:hypothetical protein
LLPSLAFDVSAHPVFVAARIGIDQPVVAARRWWRGAEFEVLVIHDLAGVI